MTPVSWFLPAAKVAMINILLSKNYEITLSMLLRDVLHQTNASGLVELTHSLRQLNVNGISTSKVSDDLSGLKMFCTVF